jgi:hypothetical protein
MGRDGDPTARTTPNSRGGRPRNPAIDEVVRRTTAELLADEGYDATDRAGDLRRRRPAV